MPPTVEVVGSKPKVRIQIEDNLEIDYEDGEILLIPTVQTAADALNKIIGENPKTNLKLKADDSYELAVEGIRVQQAVVETERTRVLDPVAK